MAVVVVGFYWGNLSINANYGSQDGQFKQPPAFLTTVKVGNNLARLRPFSASGDVVYRREIWNDWRFLASLTYRHESGGFQDGENTARLDNFDTFSGRLALESRNYLFAVRAANLTDFRYYTNQSGTALGNGILDNYRLNDPRYVEATVSYRW